MACGPRLSSPPWPSGIPEAGEARYTVTCVVTFQGFRAAVTAADIIVSEVMKPT
jgi:hypothetical protein